MVDFSDMQYAGGFGGPDHSTGGINGDGGQITLDQAKSAAMGVTQPHSYNWATTIAGDTAFGVSDLVDTVASSIPGVSKAIGLKRGDVNDAVISALGVPGLRDFYNENQGGIHAASGVMGIVAADLLTSGLAGAAPVVGILSKASWARKALALDSEYKSALKAVNIADETLAARGITGSRLFTESMGELGVPALTKAGLDPALATSSRAALLTKTSALGFAKGAVRAAGTEATMAVTLNQNDFLYSSDMSENLKNAALGLGVGGVVGGSMAKYAIRKFANSDLVRRITAGALDPTGLDRAMTAAPVIPEKGSDFAKVVDSTNLGNLQGAKTDRIVALYTDARAPQPAGVDASTFSRKQTQTEVLAQEEMQKVTVKGINYVDGTGFSKTMPGYGNHLDMLNHKDPAAMMGVEMLGAVPEGMGVTGLHEERTAQLSQRLASTKEYIQSEDFQKLSDGKKAQVFQQLKQLNFENRLVPQAVIDGEVTPMSTASAFDNWSEPSFSKQVERGTRGGPDVTTYEATDLGGKSRQIGLDSQGQIYLPGDRTINNASHSDMLTLFRAGGQYLRDLVKADKPTMTLPKSPSWFHLDMAEELLKKNPNATVMFPDGLTRETAQIESFAQKVDAVKNRPGGLPTGDEAASLRVRYNLPRLTAFENGLLGTSDTPADVILRGAAQKGGGDAIRGMTLSDLQAGFDAQRQITDLAGKTAAKADTIQGNMFNFLTDDAGNPTKPMLMYRRPFMEEDWTRDNLAERLAIKKAQTTQYLMGPQASGFTRDVASFMATSPDSQLASQVGGLADTQIASNLVPLAGNQAASTPFGRFINGTVTAEWRARDNPALLAATRLRESVDRLSQANMKGIFTSNLGDQVVTINSPRNRASRFMLDQFHSFGQGWDFEPKTIPTTLADGSTGHQFQLSDTVNNADRFRSIHGRAMNKGEVLLDPKGNPITLDEMGMQFQTSLNRITDQLRTEKNTLLEATGLPTISSKPFYIPPPNVEGKFVGFTFDAQGQVVPGGTIIANTEQEFNKLRSKISSDPNAIMNRDGHTFKSQNEVMEYATLLDKAQMDMMSPGRTYIQGAKTAEGGLLSPQINMRALDDSLETVRNEFLQHGRDVLEVQMDDQLKAAKVRSAISNPEQAQGKGAFGIKDGGKNIYDYYTEALTGRSPIASEKSVLGRIQATIEQYGNSAITAAAASQPGQLARMAGSKMWHVANDWVTRVNPFVDDPYKGDVFKQLTEKLGNDMPFAHVGDLMESQGYGMKPANLRSLAAGTSRFEATWVLRVMEPMQAVMNLTGVLNAAPAVVRNMAMREGESTADFAQRVGHVADIFTTPDGANSYGVMNMGKLMWNGFKRAWSGAADGDWQRLADKGMLSQEVAEFQRAFNAAETRSGWDKFMNGDPVSNNKFAKKGVLGWASYLTDASEDYSRAWAHMIGDGVAEHLGITDTVARDNMAHDLANKMIANYNPNNRPAMFQGVIGTPIGLFQGFIWAYYQRMFRYLETGDARALATQYATQAASFGLKTVPGYNEINSMWFKHSDGKNSPYDEIYNRFGASAGNLLMGGVWGNLPRLIGGQALDLSSRGDTTFRVPVATMPAVFATAQKMYNGVGQALALFGKDNPHLAGQQIAEIAANTIPNRPIANMIEQFGGGGYDTDAGGNVISATVDPATHIRDWFATTARVLGTRTMTQSNDLEAFYANKQGREIAAQHRETLDANTRELIRSGDLSNLDGVFNSYLAGGGDPRQYKRWVKTTFDTATKTRSQRQLAQLKNNPQNQAYVDRLLGAQTGISAESNQPDPAEAMQVQDTMENEMPTSDAGVDPGMAYGAPPQQ